MPELAAAVVILKDRRSADRVLIVRRSKTESFLPRRWGVPCGKVDENETSQEAVLRELFEETGLRGAVVTQVGRSDFRSVWRGQQVENVQHNYLVSTEIDPAQVDRYGMPKVVMPMRDQKARWVPPVGLEKVGLDLHNFLTIKQGLDVYLRDQLVSSTSTASS
jgi:8-oxo-dGTP diphosphatase